jgi:hypothetical protein
MTSEDLIWDLRQGRYSEEAGGARFLVWILVHGSGRIYGGVHCPLGEDWYYRCVFYLDPSFDRDDYRFIDLDSAKRFMLDTVLRFHRPAPEASPQIVLSQN